MFITRPPPRSRNAVQRHRLAIPRQEVTRCASQRSQRHRRCPLLPFIAAVQGRHRRQRGDRNSRPDRHSSRCRRCLAVYLRPIRVSFFGVDPLVTGKKSLHRPECSCCSKGVERHPPTCPPAGGAPLLILLRSSSNAATLQASPLLMVLMIGASLAVSRAQHLQRGHLKGATAVPG